MNHNKTNRLGIHMPSDADSQTKALAELLAEATIQSLYAKLPTYQMKFIVAACFELGYPQELVAEMCGMRQGSLAETVSNIRRVFLGVPYRPKKVKNDVKLEDAMKALILLRGSQKGKRV